MSRGNLMEYCPLQVLSYEDTEKLVAGVRDEMERKDVPARLPAAVRPAWNEVTAMVRQALLDARLFGAPTGHAWITRIEDRMDHWQTALGADDYRALRIAYMDYLDSLYGAILRHALSHMPLSVMMPMAQLRLYRVSLYRYTMVKNAADGAGSSKGALEQVVEMMYNGGGRFELDFEVKMRDE